MHEHLQHPSHMAGPAGDSAQSHSVVTGGKIQSGSETTYIIIHNYIIVHGGRCTCIYNVHIISADVHVFVHVYTNSLRRKVLTVGC